jgi:predicted ATPase
MKIDTIGLHGYKSFKKIDAFPLRNLNVLIGANGAGKSNFISLFKLMAALSQGNLQRFVQQQGGPDTLLYGGRKRSTKIEVQLRFAQNGGFCNGYDIALIPTSDNRLVFEHEAPWLRGVNYKDGISYPLGSAHDEAKLLTDIRSASGYVRLWMTTWKQYHFHDTSDSAAVKQPHGSNDNLRLKPQADNLAAYLVMLHNQHPDSYARIVDTIRLAAPFFGGFVIRNPLPANLELEWFDQADPDTPYRAHMLSDGTLRFICLTTLLLQPVNLLPDTILIDEPELGLHPYAINLLADLMKQVAETKQLIVSTQSVELLNSFEPEDVVVAQREQGATTLERLDAGELRAWLDDEYELGDLWKRNVLGGRPSR